MQNQNVNFTWVPPVGVPLSSILSYRFKVIELQQGQNPLKAVAVLVGTVVRVVVEGSSEFAAGKSLTTTEEESGT